MGLPFLNTFINKFKHILIKKGIISVHKLSKDNNFTND